MNETVLIVGNFLSGCGGSRGVCEDLAERLPAAGWPVITTSGRRNKAARLVDMLTTTWCRRDEYSVAQVDVYSGPAFVWAACVCRVLRWARKPHILTLHGGSLPEFATAHPQQVKKVLANATAVTAPSRYLQEQMSPYRRDIQLIPNGLELARYTYRERVSPKPNMVWLRALHAIYNPTMAVEVLATVVRDQPKAHLWMVGPDKGDGSRQQVEEAAARLGVADHVTFVGGVPKADVPAWLNRGDIFLNTTDVDNTPVSVLEACASGMCVVSTNVGGLPYLLDESTARLVPPREPAVIAEAVLDLLAHPAECARLSQNARELASTHDWAVVMQQWKRLLQQTDRLTNETLT